MNREGQIGRQWNKWPVNGAPSTKHIDHMPIIYDLFRPLYAPVTSALRRRLGRNYGNHPEMELPPPYEYVQLDVERHLHKYLHVQPEEIAQIVIVGALDASEVPRMQRTYLNATFSCFEPNPNTHRALLNKFKTNANVSISDFALGRSPGKARFYELPLAGNGSLLEPDMQKWTASNRQTENHVRSFEVNVSTLDREVAALAGIDLLWMDVQGAEAEVLAGGPETLKRTNSVFLEVALADSPYKGAVLFREVRTILESQNFQCAGIGSDAWNGSANAFFVRDLDKRVAESFK